MIPVHCSFPVDRACLPEDWHEIVNKRTNGCLFALHSLSVMKLWDSRLHSRSLHSCCPRFWARFFPNNSYRSHQLRYGHHHHQVITYRDRSCHSRSNQSGTFCKNNITYLVIFKHVDALSSEYKNLPHFRPVRKNCTTVQFCNGT